MSLIAETPEPPYYAVIFTSLMSDDPEGYEAMAERMLALAKERSGFLGLESAREAVGLTVSYWRDLEAIASWKQDIDHRYAQRLGRERWYAAYRTRIARVEREYGR
ncbi:antibiotic biosynthesis monooxygenase family protein [Salinicola halophilus]|uniref:antibiotic biosynthesis monooxygenase family protein n=1 Tax=Salinicola halophilus TaxID=184065 RepID=UPI000DA1B7BD|nr:antibiotic biosynthesis monooxygenase [Salinicola halophilus]